MKRKKIRKVIINPKSSIKKRNVTLSVTNTDRQIKPRIRINNNKIIITPELYLNNENFSNSLRKKSEKEILFNELDKYALSEYNIAKTKGGRIINMVFHGHWGWVFSMMVEKYTNLLKDYHIISSVNPIQGCDVYQYWRPVSPGMKLMIKKYPPTHEFFRKGIHMVHDSPYDNFRSNTAFRKSTLNHFHSLQCTSLEQFNFYNNFKGDDTYSWYTPLGVSENIIKKPTYNSNGKIRLGFCGRIYSDKVKGEEELIKLAKQLPRDKFEFVIASPNAETYVNILTNELGFNVYNKGAHGMNYVYSKIDVTLILSKYEGTPLPLIESIKSGTYVLGNDVGEVSTLLNDQHIIKSIKDLKNKLNKIYDDRSILKTFFEESEDLIKDRTWYNFITQSENIWKTIW